MIAVLRKIMIGLAAVAVILFVVSAVWMPTEKVKKKKESIDAEPAKIENTLELIQENKVTSLTINEKWLDGGVIKVVKGGVISFYNLSSSEARLRITGSLFTEISVEAGGTIVSPVFRLRGDYKLEDLMSSKSAMIKVI